MEGTARCISCFRIERRRGAEVVEVTMAGGGRRPAIPGELAAWRTFRRVKAGELGPAVAVCAACGQPMFATEGQLPALPRWEFQLPDGPVAVGPDGRVIDGDDEAADEKVEAHHKAALDAQEQLPAGQVGFALVLLAAVMAIGGIIGMCECPSMAVIAAGTAAASGARKR
jgi:hypothetical protein